MTQTIGAYRVTRRLAGDGELYLGRTPEGARCHIRRIDLSAKPNALDEVKRCTAVCAKLDHPAVGKTLDLFLDAGKLVIVGEPIDGAPLDRLLEKILLTRGPLEPAAVWYLCQQVAGALAQAHGAEDESGVPTSVCHGHLSPKCVAISWNGFVRVDGFGLAAVVGAAGVERQPGYAAPEEGAGGPVTPRGDVYSLAALNWALLAGQAPVQELTLAAVASKVPASLREVLARALASSVRERRVTSMELEHALGALDQTQGKQALANAVGTLRRGSTLLGTGEATSNRFPSTPSPANLRPRMGKTSRTPADTGSPGSDRGSHPEIDWDAVKASANRPLAHVASGGQSIDALWDDDSHLASTVVRSSFPPAMGGGGSGAAEGDLSAREIAEAIAHADDAVAGQSGVADDLDETPMGPVTVPMSVDTLDLAEKRRAGGRADPAEPSPPSSRKSVPRPASRPGRVRPASRADGDPLDLSEPSSPLREIVDTLPAMDVSDEVFRMARDPTGGLGPNDQSMGGAAMARSADTGAARVGGSLIDDDLDEKTVVNDERAPNTMASVLGGSGPSQHPGSDPAQTPEPLPLAVQAPTPVHAGLLIASSPPAVPGVLLPSTPPPGTLEGGSQVTPWVGDPSTPPYAPSTPASASAAVSDEDDRPLPLWIVFVVTVATALGVFAIGIWFVLSQSGIGAGPTEPIATSPAATSASASSTAGTTTASTATVVATSTDSVSGSSSTNDTADASGSSSTSDTADASGSSSANDTADVSGSSNASDTADASGSSSASATPSVAPVVPVVVDDGKDGKELNAGEGYLIVRFAGTEGQVFITITPYGPPNTKLKVPCGTKFIRIGVGKYPATKWISKGLPVAVRCQAVTEATLPK